MPLLSQIGPDLFANRIEERERTAARVVATFSDAHQDLWDAVISDGRAAVGEFGGPVLKAGAQVTGIVRAC